MPNSTKVGVVVGRFQIDDLHEGHLSLLDHVIERHARILVLLGCRPANATRSNPLDYRTREAMIRRLYPQATVLPLMDASTDAQWTFNVDAAIRAAFPGTGAILYGGQDNSMASYQGRHMTLTVDTCVATEHAVDRREDIAANPLITTDFRAGVIYSLHAQYPRTEMTVDIAAFSRDFEGKLRMAVGRKHGEEQCRFPGGFIDRADTHAASAACRELHEETNLFAAESSLILLQDFVIDDWRTRGQDDLTIRTILFATWAKGANTIKPADDLADAWWLAVDKADRNPEMFVLAHRPMLDFILETKPWEKVEPKP